jgi:hypothetical protein
MKRRDFLRKTALAAAVLPVLPAISLAQELERDLRAAVAAHMHGDGVYLGRATDLFEGLKRFGPDFIEDEWLKRTHMGLSCRSVAFYTVNFSLHVMPAEGLEYQSLFIRRCDMPLIVMDYVYPNEQPADRVSDSSQEQSIRRLKKDIHDYYVHGVGTDINPYGIGNIKNQNDA